MTDLSPAALGVVLAWLSADRSDEPKALAAALRAAADHLDAESPWPGHIESTGVNWSRNELHKIAAELEAQS
jgi:hypothetical protein